jgi:hypothetical protein
VASYDIGIGGDYTTIVTWEDASPSTLTELYEGRLLNNRFHSGAVTRWFEIAGQSTTDSFFMRLTYDTGLYHGGDVRSPDAPRIGEDTSISTAEQIMGIGADQTELVGLVVDPYLAPIDSVISDISTTGGIRIKVYECIFIDIRGPIFDFFNKGGARTEVRVRNCVAVRCHSIVRISAANSYGPRFFINNCSFMYMLWWANGYPEDMQGSGCFEEVTRASTTAAEIRLLNVYIDGITPHAAAKGTEGGDLISSTYSPDFHADCDYIATSDATASNTGATNYKHNVTRDLTVDPSTYTLGEDPGKDYQPSSEIHDVYADENDPTTNKNTGGLHVKGFSGTDERRSYISWDRVAPDPLMHFDHFSANLYGFGLSTTYQKVAIAFKPKATGVCNWVQIELQIAAGTPTDNVRVSIQTKSGSDPTGTVVGDYTDVPAAAIAASSDIRRIPVCGSSLTVDTTYYLVLERTGSLSDTDYYYIMGTVIDYPDCPETGYRYYNGSSWNTVGGGFLKFVIDNPYSIIAARLFVTPYDGDGSTDGIMRAQLAVGTAATWDEATMNWNTKPSVGWGAGGTIPFPRSASSSYLNIPYPIPIPYGYIIQTLGIKKQGFSFQISGWNNANYGYCRDGEYSTAADRPYLEVWYGQVDYAMPESQTALYKWGTDLTSDTFLPVTEDITGISRFWWSAGAWDGSPGFSGEVSEPASVRVALRGEVAEVASMLVIASSEVQAAASLFCILFGMIAEAASLRTAAEFQLAYPTSDQQETGTWTHASTPDLHSAVDDAFGTDDGHVIDSP